MEGWKKIEDAEHGFSLWVPKVSASGLSVEIRNKEKDGARGIHALTEDRHEIYFEVVSYPGHVDHANQYSGHKENILKNFDNAVVSEMVQDRFLNHSATVFSFESENFARRFLLFDTPVRTYRLVYDHHYPQNEEVLKTFELVQGD